MPDALSQGSRRALRPFAHLQLVEDDALAQPDMYSPAEAKVPGREYPVAVAGQSP